MLRKTIEGVTKQRKLHNEMLVVCNICLFYWSCYINVTEMGGAHGMHGEEEEFRIGVWCRSLKDGDLLRNVALEGRIILKWVFLYIMGGDVNWIHLAQDRVTWQAAVNEVMDFRLPHNGVKLLFSRRTVIQRCSQTSSTLG
jgi:hypothetical protein